MAGGFSSFDPARMEAFRALNRQMPDEFDPAAFEAAKAKRAAPAAAPAGDAPLTIRVRPNNVAPEPDLAPAPVPPSAVEGSAWDVGKTILPGIVRGANAVLGAPANLMNLADMGWQYGTSKLLEATGALTPEQAEGIRKPIPGLEDRRMRGVFPSSEAINDLTNAGLRKVGAPELYKPTTLAGQVINAVLENGPSGALTPGSVAQRVGQVFAPAVVGEGAGQVADRVAPDYATAARIGGAMVGGVGAGIAQMPRGGRATLEESIRTAGPDRFDEAVDLMQRGAALPGGGVGLSFDEALNKATGGQASRASQLARVVANSGGEGQRIASEFYAARPGQMDASGRAVFDMLAPSLSDPSRLVEALQRAGRAGVAQTPEGVALAEARAAAGPRVTPEDAGLVMQPELRGVYDRREGMRAALGERDYGLAREAPERVGIDRTVSVERPGEPIVTQARYSRPQFMDDAPAPLPPAPAVEAAARPQSLVQFLARNGGIPLDAEAKAADLNRLYVPGNGTLARGNAPTWDQIRVQLSEAGFLPTDGQGYARAASVRDFVLDAIHKERIGRGGTFRMGDEGLSGSRAGQAGDEYAAAVGDLSARLDDGLTRVGVSPAGVHPDIRSRTLNALMDDPRLEPLDAFERVVGSMRENPRPFSRSTTITEEISAPRFGQANPQGVVSYIDDSLRSAKGPVATALQQARRAMFEPDGQTLDLSVAGLHGAREAIGDLIEKGTPQAQRALMGVRDQLDRALSSVPEYEAARAGFEAASRPLDAFEGTALAGIVARDQKSGRLTMPPERVPGAIDAGPTQARAFNEVATPAARRAYENRLTTQLLDGAADGQGNLSADRLRVLMRDNEDQLRQYPSVRERLGNVATAREGLAAVERSPLGQVANAPTVRKAIDAIFPSRGELVAGQEREIRQAMFALRRNDVNAAQELGRIHLETVFNDAMRERRGLAAQYGGAGFASAIRGNVQQRKNLEAALSVLPDGGTRAKALDHLLTVFEATGYKPMKGSDTAFNLRLENELAGGRSVGSAIASAAATGAAGSGINGFAGAAGGAALGLKRAVSDAWTRYQLGKNGGEIARLLFDPKALPELRALAQTRPGTRTSDVIVGRLLANAVPSLGKVAPDR